MIVTAYIIGSFLMALGFYYLGWNLSKNGHEDGLDQLFENIAEDESLTYWEKEYVFGVIYDHAPPELGIEFPN